MSAESHPRRSLSARRGAIILARQLITGQKSLKNLRESEKTELLACLDQSAEFMDWALTHQAQLQAIAKAP